MDLNVYTDGGSRGNPGIAGIGVYITNKSGKEIEKRYKSLGVATNNIAEYTGAFYGIKRAIELGAKKMNLFMDSNLVIKQLSGEWKIKNNDLRKIKLEIDKIIQKGKIKVNYNWIKREENKQADRLSNVAMDKG